MAKNTRKTQTVTKKGLIRQEREQRQRRILLSSILAIGILVIVVVGYGLLDQLVLKQLQSVAEVDGEKISLKSFQNRVQFSRYQLIQQYYNNLSTYQMFAEDEYLGEYFLGVLQEISTQLENPQLMGQTVIDQMISEIIIEQEAEILGVTISDAEIDGELKSVFGFFPDGTPIPTLTPTIAVTSTLSSLQKTLVTQTPIPTEISTSTPDPAATEVIFVPTITSTPVADPTITPTATPYTLELYEEQLSEYIDELSSEINQSEEDLRKLVFYQLLRDEVSKSITSDMVPEEEQAWARHILVTGEDTANSVLERLENGADWTALAAELSEDTSNKDMGGDLGWFGHNKMVTEFEDVAFQLGIGEISEPVETQFGFHIIQVLGHEIRPLSATEFETAKQAFFTEWLQEKLSSDLVQRFDDIWINQVPMEPTISPEYIQNLGL
jgi:peptidyl-prolyl cis-trans isomerase D